jgi:succinate dehydrogenase / fumarate reductase flavoprotein subunit
MYEKITGIDAYKEPMKISPAAHFSMGGLWVDYELSTTVPGLYALGECNFSDHGANRLGANSLLQACVDGYFIIPNTIGPYLADDIETGSINTNHPEFDVAEQKAAERLQQLANINGNKSVDYFHKKLGRLLWDYCGVTRQEKGLKKAISEIKDLEKEFWADVKVPGLPGEINSELEKAGRVADYLEFGVLMCYDALTRNESCGAHFREEYQTDEGEALRDDKKFQFISCWKHEGDKEKPQLIKEPLIFEATQPVTRVYEK